MGQITITYDLDRAEDVEKLKEALDVLVGNGTEADKPAAKTTRSRGTKTAPKEEPEDKAPATRSRSRKAPAKKGDDLEDLIEEGRVIQEKVVEQFRKDIKDELKFYGVASISDFKDKADLAEYIVFLKELEEDLDEEEDEPAPPARRSRARK